MRFGLIHYNAPGETLEAFLDYAAQTGFDAVELQIGDVWNEEDPDDDPEARCAQVRAMAEARGIAIGVLAASNDFLTIDPDEIAFQVARMRRVCGLVKLLGANIIRAEGGWKAEKVPEEQWADALANCFRQCVPFLEEMEVYLGLDNHGKVTNDAFFQMLVLGLVGSKYVGTTMDTMNYRWMGYSLDRCNRFYELSSKRCVHLHLKDGVGSLDSYRGAVLGEGEIDLAHAIRQLKAAGYDGLWCIEYEGRDADGYTRCLKWAKANVPKIK